MELILTDDAIRIEREHDYISFIPSRTTCKSGAYDVRACILNPIKIQPGDIAKISLGFRCYIGSTHSKLGGFIIPRSGLGNNNGIVLGNLVGLVDEDYQEVWGITIWNRSDIPFTIIPGMKLAQVVFIPLYFPEFEIKDFFSNSKQRI